MATAYKILGQSYPSGGVLTTAYTVPAATTTVVSTITVCNTSSIATTYRINIRKNGDTAAQSKQYIAYDAPISGNDTIALTLGITLDAQATVNVYSTATACAFNIFGSEIS
jgi:hypothetical protein